MSGDAVESSGRTFLFLQGPASPIFARIADRLEALGHRCLRINICIGDWLFWRRKGGLNYRGSFADWPAYIQRLVENERVTDLVFSGEERPYHRAAIDRAVPLGVDVYCIDMGYLRPDWISIERGGGGCNSHFPDDPDQILAAAAGLPEPDFDTRFRQSFAAEAAYDLLFNLPNVFLWFPYPHYRRHGLFHPLAEYFGWVRRLLGRRGRAATAQAVVEKFVPQGPPYFLFPLQLQTDYQLRAHSPFGGQQEALALVIASFAGHAPPAAHLVLKLHPLDNGLIDWDGFIRQAAVAHRVEDRVHVIDGGDLDRLISGSKGVVTINSTVGIQAVRLKRPIKVLGTAIYDMAGLSDQQPLDRFWTAPDAGDDALRAAFVRLLAASIHVRGGFLSAQAIAAGAAAIADRLDKRTVNLPGAYVVPPPRQRPLKRASSAARGD